MKKARVILVMTALSGLMGGALAYYSPKVYYKPLYEGGVCTVAVTPYQSILPDVGMNFTKGKRVALAKEPGECGSFIIVGE